MAPEPGHDIFISYAREDEERLRPLVHALEAQGWRVFWDRAIPVGETWLDHIGTRLDAAPIVLVAWSRHSIRSEFVYSEASRARARRALVPVLIEPVSPPLGLDSVQAADLVSWFTAGGRGALPSVLVDAIGRRMGAPATPVMSPPSADEPPSRPNKPRVLWRPAASTIRTVAIAAAVLGAIVVAAAVFVPPLLYPTQKPLAPGTPRQASTDERPGPIAPDQAVPTAVLTPLPFPSVDFELDGRLGVAGGAGAGTLVVLRHGAGKLRIEYQAFGAKGFMLLTRGSDIGTMVMVQPPNHAVAMDFDVTKPMPGHSTGMGIWWFSMGARGGADRVLGEPCEWWHTNLGEPLRTCITADGIPIKTVRETDGETQWQVERLERRLQDPAQFAVPANAQRMQAPQRQ